jgi:signal recognition particle subunit SRP54
MFSKLSKNLSEAVKNLTGKNKLTESNLSTTLKEIRRSLISADVEFKIAKEITESIKNEVLGQKVLENVSVQDKFIKIFRDKLTEIMGNQSSEIIVSKNPFVILLCGLQGVGKTTLSVKLANFFKKKGKNSIVAACDIYRPAATEQLKIFGEKSGVEVFSIEKDPLTIAKESFKKAKEEGIQILIIDTAGRLSIDEKMMKEILDIKNELKPSEILYVVDSRVGQSAIETAKQFNDKIDFSGVVLTKMDGDSRGGVALTIYHQIKKPIKFISDGEKADDLSIFHPDRMASLILGMGDTVSLVEKMEEIYSKEEEAKLKEKIKKNKFDFSDFKEQIGSLKKMGSMKSILSMIPGMNDKLDNMEFDEKILDKYRYMIDSMTLFERSNPSKICKNRIERISKGCGIKSEEVNDMINKFFSMQKMLEGFQKNKKLFSSFGF